ncbi:MAG: hypothetical protein KKA42_11615 [candidate division Zixibacteria bacterium]|nr:hypothetical protein [candidate division Zixibacteria bacterium]
MRKVLVFVIAALCGWAGWWLGNQVGLMTALLLSMVGTGLGMYFGRRLIQF